MCYNNFNYNYFSIIFTCIAKYELLSWYVTNTWPIKNKLKSIVLNASDLGIFRYHLWTFILRFAKITFNSYIIFILDDRKRNLNLKIEV